MKFILKAKSQERKIDVGILFAIYLIKPRKNKQNKTKSAIYTLIAFVVVLI